MVMNPDDIFKTTDIALSAYLIVEGHGNPDTNFNGSKASFIFQRSEKLDDSISLFDTGEAIGNIVKFFTAYQTLLRRIRERY